MYKLYSVHVNDLLRCPKSLMQFSSSACPQFVIRWLECSLMTLPTSCVWTSRKEGFDRTLLILVHRNAQGPHVPVVQPSHVFCSLSEHVLLPCSISSRPSPQAVGQLPSY